MESQTAQAFKAQDEEIKALKDQLRKLTEKSETKMIVKMPLARKLSKFDGSNLDVKDWVEDARGVITGLEKPEQLTFIIRHLDGIARKEVKLARKQHTDEAEKVFTLLGEAFGETRSSARIKRLLYERTQGEKETVREFTRGLLEIVDKLKDDDTVKDGMLKEVLCENVCDKSVRRELKRMTLEKPGLDFTDLRAFAIKLVDSEIETKKTTARAHEVEATADVCARDVNVLEPLRELTNTLKTMMEQQAKLIELVTSRATVSGVSGVSDNMYTPRRRTPLSEIQCYGCHKYGHYRSDCPERRGGQDQGRRTGRNQHDRDSSTRSQDGEEKHAPQTKTPKTEGNDPASRQ